jgi:hypothetical protein
MAAQSFKRLQLLTVAGEICEMAGRICGEGGGWRCYPEAHVCGEA